MNAVLLDVNVLLALAWPNHQHHSAAQRWFAGTARRGWATCPLTELAFVRLSCNPAFTPGAVALADALQLLAIVRKLRGHRSWMDLPDVSDLGPLELRGHQQVNDAYLLLLARRHGGVLATFDARIAAWAGAGKDVVVIPS